MDRAARKGVGPCPLATPRRWQQAPRISLWKLKIEKNIARILKVNPKVVNLKATTAEGVGEIGKNKAMAAWCAVLLRRSQ